MQLTSENPATVIYMTEHLHWQHILFNKVKNFHQLCTKPSWWWTGAVYCMDGSNPSLTNNKHFIVTAELMQNTHWEWYLRKKNSNKKLTFLYCFWKTNFSCVLQGTVICFILQFYWGKTPTKYYLYLSPYITFITIKSTHYPYKSGSRSCSIDLRFTTKLSAYYLLSMSLDAYYILAVLRSKFLACS